MNLDQNFNHGMYWVRTNAKAERALDPLGEQIKAACRDKNIADLRQLHQAWHATAEAMLRDGKRLSVDPDTSFFRLVRRYWPPQ